VSSNNGPMERLFTGALLFAGATLAIYISLQVLASIWGWILLVALILGVIAGGVALAVYLVRRRSSRW
jgi:hypothetical protein